MLSSIFQKKITKIVFEISSPRQKTLTKPASHMSTHTDRHHTNLSRLWGEGVLLGHLAIIPSPTVVLRAEIMASCQGKCREMFAWREHRVPVGEQGELRSPTP